MIMFLESERLYLREIVEEDFEILRHLDTDMEVLKFIAPPWTHEQSVERMNKAFRQYKEGNGFGKWLAVEKDTGKAIGWYILYPLLDTEYIEIGYRLKQEFWGRGYATEMSKVLLDYGFKKLGVEKIAGVTNIAHDISGKVLLKIGLEYRGIEYFYGQDVKFYALENLYKN